MIIKIKGLYQKCDISFNLDKPCQIFTGANGVGKSSALNILRHLLSGDFISILKYKFDSIEIYTKNTDDLSENIFCSIDNDKNNSSNEYSLLEILNYNDFILTKKLIKTSIIVKPSIITSNSLTNKMIDELDEKNLFGEFIYNAYNSTLLSSSLKPFLVKYIYQSDYYIDSLSNKDLKNHKNDITLNLKINKKYPCFINS